MKAGLYNLNNELIFSWEELETQGFNIEENRNITSRYSKQFPQINAKNRLVVPEGVTKIGDRAFCECHDLVSIYLPDSVSYIGEKSFLHCFSLQEINIPKNVNKIGADAFVNTPWLIKKRNCNPLVVINNILIDGKKVKDKVVIVPDNVTAIADNAFSCNNEISKIILPDNLEYLGNSAFFSCKSLTTINIPNKITSLKYKTFSCCKMLNDVRLPDALSTIGHEAFYNCKSLSEIDIPKSVVRIVNNPFSNCPNLKAIYVHNETLEKNHTFAKKNKNIIKIFTLDDIIKNCIDNNIPQEEMINKINSFNETCI